jgi:hypothetical protein
LTNLISCYAFMCAYVQKRRDRINKKMRALQDLIPNSNKVGTIFIRNLINIYVLFHNLFLNFFFFWFCSSTCGCQVDKASMLGEAIDYLKSLQLQVQVYISLLSVFDTHMRHAHDLNNLTHICSCNPNCVSWGR